MKIKVFEKNNIGGIEVNNRFIRSAAGSGIASVDGYVTDNVMEWYTEIAQGEIGLIITEMMTAWDDGNFPEKYLRIDDDTYIDGLRKIANIVHSNNSKIISQIGNYGTLLHWEPKTQPMGPSKAKDLISGITAMEMTKKDIKFVVNKFIEAALRSKAAGFDGVQVHAAHGFLLSKFINPYYNRRNDEYGGSMENGARIIVEILNGIKGNCGNDFPVYLKINCSDFAGNTESFTFEDSRTACKILSKAGYDAIEISGGIAGGQITPARSNKEVAYHKEYAEIIAEEIDTPVVVVGGIRSLELSEEILHETKIQGISLTRALTFDPKLIKKWKEGNIDKSKCISCNKCFTTEGQLCIFKGIN